MAALAKLPIVRPALSPAARALRLQRIFARLQEGASYKDIAVYESLSRERLRQIVRAATTRRNDQPDHKRMQFARLEPALRLAARGVAIRAHSTTRLCSGTWTGLMRRRRDRSLNAPALAPGPFRFSLRAGQRGERMRYVDRPIVFV